MEASRAVNRKDVVGDLAGGSGKESRGALPVCNTKKLRSGVLPPLQDRPTQVSIRRRTTS